MDGEDDCRRRQTTSKGLNIQVPFDFRDLGRLSPHPSPSPVSKVEGVPRTSIQKVNGFPTVPHAIDILAAVALIYGAEVLAGFVDGAPGIASVRSAMSKIGRLSDASAPECIGLQRHQTRLAD
jgi:hypothetical protein